MYLDTQAHYAPTGHVGLSWLDGLNGRASTVAGSMGQMSRTSILVTSFHRLKLAGLTLNETRSTDKIRTGRGFWEEASKKITISQLTRGCCQICCCFLTTRLVTTLSMKQAVMSIDRLVILIVRTVASLPHDSAGEYRCRLARSDWHLCCLLFVNGFGVTHHRPSNSHGSINNEGDAIPG